MIEFFVVVVVVVRDDAKTKKRGEGREGSVVSPLSRYFCCMMRGGLRDFFLAHTKKLVRRVCPSLLRPTEDGKNTSDS